jgi:hypothetical protein
LIALKSAKPPSGGRIGAKMMSIVLVLVLSNAPTALPDESNPPSMKKFTAMTIHPMRRL